MVVASPPTALPPAGGGGTPNGLPSWGSVALPDYKPPPGVHDEMLAADGSLRPAWRGFMEGLLTLPAIELADRWDKARHLLHENGVSYNVYGDPRGMERPWSLSPVPVLLDGKEWAALSAAVGQRARLCDRLLADLYGPQRVLLEGWVPPALVFRHASFLRALCRVRVPSGCWLPLYGVDLVRGPDGGWRALADRTQAPSGAGYALENRIVVARALPELFRECNVERLALFFRRLQETLADLAPHNRDRPRVVLLTAGPYNATYFEQAYLAQYLGYTLASGGDLTVRDDRVFLKTLSGLQQVDVILRRVNDDYCDPLELRPDSVLGVPGLVQAVRQGNVAMANPLGAGLLQTAALLPYLPGLCRHLLGEELKLPSVETFWCGDPQSMHTVRQRFDELVFKPAFPQGYTHPLFGGSLSQADRRELRARVEASPGDWVAQEQVAASTTPVLQPLAEGQTTRPVAPRSLVLRSYAVATPDGYRVMPGALARVAGSADNPEVSMQAGAGSKDTWVLSSGPVAAFSLLPPASHPVELTRGGGDLPSRTADNLYWLGRYAERAEGTARLGRVVVGRVHETPGEPSLAAGSELEALFRALSVQTEREGAPVVLPVEVGSALSAVEGQLVDTLLDLERTGSLAAIAHRALRVARMVRDRLSADTWRVLAALEDMLTAPEHSGLRAWATPGARTRSSVAVLGPMAALLDRLVLTLAAFSGLAMDSMTRGQAWRLLDLGRRIERATTLMQLLSSTMVAPAEREAPLLEAILDVADSGMTYRRRYLANLQAAPVLDLLLTDETNPRSIMFQLRALVEHLEALPAASGSGVRSPQVRAAVAALAELQLADPELLAEVGPDGRRQALGELLARLAEQLPRLSDAISSGYLTHAMVSRHLGSTRIRKPHPTDKGEGGEGGDV